MKIVEDEMMNRWEVENLHLESELMENQEEEEADDLIDEIDLSIIYYTYILLYKYVWYVYV